LDEEDMKKVTVPLYHDLLKEEGLDQTDLHDNNLSVLGSGYLM
jgi:hypothetical protein